MNRVNVCVNFFFLISLLCFSVFLFPTCRSSSSSLAWLLSRLFSSLFGLHHWLALYVVFRFRLTIARGSDGSHACVWLTGKSNWFSNASRKLHDCVIRLVESQVTFSHLIRAHRRLISLFFPPHHRASQFVASSSSHSFSSRRSVDRARPIFLQFSLSAVCATMYRAKLSLLPCSMLRELSSESAEAVELWKEMAGLDASAHICDITLQDIITICWMLFFLLHFHSCCAMRCTVCFAMVR